jgi:tetratricopeptide (TPR) repeat protein
MPSSFFPVYYILCARLWLEQKEQISMDKKYWENYYTALKSEDWETAKASLEHLSTVQRNNPKVYLKLADLFQRIGDVSKALAAYHQSAWMLRQQGFVQKALALYKIILQINPFDAEATKLSKELMWEVEDLKEQQMPPMPKQETPGKGQTEAEEVTTFSRYPMLLETLPEEDMNFYMKKALSQTFDPEQTVIEEGDTSNSIYFIDSGRAKVVANILGKKLELAVLLAGDIFGEVAFITGRPRTASVIAVDTLTVFEFNEILLDEIFMKYPQVLEKIHVFYESRVQDTIAKVKSQIKK